MPTVNFQCGQCNKMMAVESAFLGKAVRCPHCKAVVTAPTQAPAPVASAPPAKDDQDSIFGEQINEDLFGAAPKPVLQVPPAPPPPPGPSPGLEPTVFQVPSLLTAPPPPPEAAAPPRAGSTANTYLKILTFVVPYALITTLLSLLFFILWTSALANRPPHPFEMLPDDGEPKAGRQTGSRTKKRIPAGDPLPAHLLVPLGQTLTIGDLQVTPVSVEQKNLVFKRRTGRYNPQMSQDPALVLHLHIKNRSKDVWFRPTDPVFDHLWKQNKDPLNVLPYTHLEVNGVRYCSPIAWNRFAERVKQHGDNLLDEYVEGQEGDSRILGPGDELNTVIVTDPKDQVPAFLPSHQGKLLWRVQLRRGLVKYQGQEWSRTVVFGVEFDKDQITKK